MYVRKEFQDGRYRNTSRTESPAVKARAKEKRDLYRPMMNIIQSQALKRNSYRVPKFFDAIMSHDGEMSQGMFRLIEFVAMTESSRARKSTDQFGKSPQFYSAEMRNMLKDGLASVMARGVGRTMTNEGIPLDGKRYDQDYQDEYNLILGDSPSI